MNTYRILFESACRQLCEDLAYDYESIKIESDEIDENELDYWVDAAGGKSGDFSFRVKIFPQKQNKRGGDESWASLQIFYSEGADSFFFDELIGYIQGHSDFLARWAAWAILNFKNKHDPVNLSSLFHGAGLQILGVPSSTDPSAILKILLAGWSALNEEILVYRFRHADDSVRYRAFSYAFYSTSGRGHEWMIFPRLGGLDSGGAGSNLRITENLIKKMDSAKIKRKYFDIDYYKFENYLAENSWSFKDNALRHNEFKQLAKNLHEPDESIFGKNFVNSFTKFRERLMENHISGALRDLRALVQQALEITCQKNKIAFTEDPKIHVLVSRLIEPNPLLDEKLRHWFNAFTDVANRPAHTDDYPTEEDLTVDVIKQRVLVTINLGSQLIHELENVLSDDIMKT